MKNNNVMNGKNNNIATERREMKKETLTEQKNELLGSGIVCRMEAEIAAYKAGKCDQAQAARLIKRCRRTHVARGN